MCYSIQQSRERNIEPGVMWKQRAWDLVSGSADFSAWLDYISGWWRVWDPRFPSLPLGDIMWVVDHEKDPIITNGSPCSSTGRRMTLYIDMDTQGFMKEINKIASVEPSSQNKRFLEYKPVNFPLLFSWSLSSSLFFSPSQQRILWCLE